MTAPTTIALTKTGSTLSEEAGAALATSAELAGAGICSGEGGMPPEEQEANSRYFYELASAQFGYREELSSSIQALHFKGGQGAKTGTGGHLPGSKNVGKIAEVRGIELGHPAVSPPTFTNLHSVDDCRRFGDRVSELSGGDPVGMNPSANHVEADLRFALDYVILNGPRRWHRRRTDHAPRPHQRSDHSSPRQGSPLPRRRRGKRTRHVDRDRRVFRPHGLHQSARTRRRWHRAVELSHASHRLRGCSNVQLQQLSDRDRNPEARTPSRLDVAASAQRLATFFNASVELMSVMARAYGRDHLSKLNQSDLATWDDKIAKLSGVRLAGYQSVDV